MNKFLANFKIFSGFQNKEKLFYTCEQGDARNHNLKKFIVRISVDFHIDWVEIVDF